ncbi:MAG: copper homeostasis protein CutC [Armatimonadetes bacterium]|nr:copper homeostasis protein CutC [Armatimonadota bacterium]MBS1702993.1 copper homeostasis protein CutC [Armatimonadota bacterium]
MLVEVIACSLADAVVAREAGADRVELCLAMEVGGITPYLVTTEQMGALAPFPVSVMVRPQPGGFNYGTDTVLSQIEQILDLRFPNLQIVSGVLNNQNEFDLAGMRAIRRATKGVPLTCHRCFDLTPYPMVALEQLIDLGFDRVLTSGQAPTAQLGLDVIANLVDQADGRIEIMPAVGIRPYNVAEIIKATGVKQVHASCFGDNPPPVPGKVDFGPTLRVSADKVRAFVSAARSA